MPLKVFHLPLDDICLGGVHFPRCEGELHISVYPPEIAVFLRSLEGVSHSLDTLDLRLQAPIYSQM